MNIVQIDGRSLHDRETLHLVLQDKLQLDEHYGHNLDALWDALTGEVHLPLTIRWLYYETCRSLLGDYADQVVEVMQEAEQEVDGFTLELLS